MAKLPLEVGTALDSAEPFNLDGAKFNRHTFWCGQSGSGKTYALGVVLERILLDTGLPVLVLDPNSDFVHLGEPVPDAPAEDAARLRAADVRVHRRAGLGERDLVIRIADMDLASRAAVLRLDPIADADEFHVLRQLQDEYGPQVGDAMINALAASDDPARTRLLRRMQNLGVTGWDVLARGEEGLEQVVEQRPDLVVADIGGFHLPEEGTVAALAVLDRLWNTRERRQPLLIVIDEAHNLCPAEPRTPLERAICDRLIQIAAEGRKFGLWLLLSTQRPSKIHPQVLSQCDNLALLKTNAPADLAQLGEYFGAVPRDLLDASPTSTQGQALFAGGFAPSPTRVQMTRRLTREGGSDVAVPGTRVSSTSPTTEPKS